LWRFWHFAHNVERKIPMASSRITPVLLAGGAGTRLWPVSRDAMPKQFLPLVGDKSTYQQTLLRVADPELFTAPIVVTRSDFHFFARQQAEEVGIKAAIVIEPMRRDSAPAIAAGALLARQSNPDAVVLALAADHIILDPDLFREACVTSCQAAEAGRIVTFGIRPTEPKTSYGYILRGEALQANDAYTVRAFVEKPDPATAARCVTEGYLWNSGNFLFRADILLSELRRFEPAMLAALERAVAGAKDDLGFLRLDPVSFAQSPQKSIDYAVMEKTDRAAVVEGRFRWSDIGSWDAIFEISDRDAAGNAVRGPVVAMDCENCVVHSDGRLTTVIGAKDLVVVTTADAVLVLPRQEAERVKDLVTMLKGRNHAEATDHRRVHRPWGHYESIDLGKRYQVKRIVVQPGGLLSLQRHMHRSEHWVVVHGTAEVTRGDKCEYLHENESVYIPIGTVHRLANHGKIPLELVEVQTGSYLGEDDIVRLEDVYRRS
jgi:mannose-1-phosphate guanylyltransferase / mannose-6-phosphate isomerase